MNSDDSLESTRDDFADWPDDSPKTIDDKQEPQDDLETPTGDATRVSHSKESQDSRRVRGRLRFQISTVLLLTVLAGICFAAGRWSPWLGIGCGVLSAFSLIHATIFAAKLNRSDQLTFGEKIIVFAGSFGVM
ncbi:MAG: hypothetical protein N2C14_24535, partial [Planctomycetales bacterium]